jgi:putative transposase
MPQARLSTHIGRVWRENREVYGVRKVWKQLHREGTPWPAAPWGG